MYRVALGALALGALALGACNANSSPSGSDCNVGEEGCDCSSDGTCDDGLRCIEDTVCSDEGLSSGSGGSRGSGGSGGAGGSGGSGGDSGSSASTRSGSQGSGGSNGGSGGDSGSGGDAGNASGTGGATGTGGTNPGTGGDTSGVGGSNASTNGTGGGQSGTGGGQSGTGGTTTGSGGTGNTVNPNLIDDFADCDENIPQVGGRNGVWYFFASDDTYIETAIGYPTSTETSWGDETCGAFMNGLCYGCETAGVAVILDDGSYDLSSWQGIRVTYESSGPIYVALKSTNGSTYGYAWTSPVPYSGASSTTRTIPFSDFAPDSAFHGLGWVQEIQFTVDEYGKEYGFKLAIHELELVP